MNNFKMIHETALRDIIDVINSVKDFDQIKWVQTKNNVGSIAKRSSDLILVFPVLVSNSLSIKTATIISKAIERKCSALLQILFASINMTSSKTLQDYISQFHTNFEIFIQILMKVLFTIASFCEAFCLLKVIYIFSPIHVAFLNTAFTLYQLIKCRTKSKDNIILTIVDGVFLLVIIFATLVFNEMLIINICGLNNNTKISFIIKEQKEIQDIVSTSNNNDNESDNDDNEENKEKVSNEAYDEGF